VNDFIILIKNGESGDEIKFVDVVTGEVKLFESGAEAAAKANGLNDYYRECNRPHRARVFRADAQKMDWRMREGGRFTSGKYQNPVWKGSPWERLDHFVHVATDDPTQIAYTPDEEHGKADRQLRCSVEHYLSKYFSTELDKESIQYWADEHLDRYGPDPEVQFATTPDAIEAVYTAGEPESDGRHFPPSCMSYADHEYESRVHPVRVYGAGDLAVAYLAAASGKGISARVLVWPEKKRYGRFFGEGKAKRLRQGLKALGYEEGSFRGAKLLRIEHDDDSDVFVCPYIDNHDFVVDSGKHLIIEGNGRSYDHLDCRNTTGLTGDPSDVCRCESCNSRIPDDDAYSFNGYSYCDSCFHEMAFFCDHCGDATDRDDRRTTPNGDDWCRDCFDNRFANCDHCEEPHLHAENHATDDDRLLCDDCFEEQYTECDDCGVELRREDAHEVDGSDYCDHCRHKYRSEDKADDCPTETLSGQGELTL
jgi:hypothetical protein